MPELAITALACLLTTSARAGGPRAGLELLAHAVQAHAEERPDEQEAGAARAEAHVVGIELEVEALHRPLAVGAVRPLELGSGADLVGEDERDHAGVAADGRSRIVDAIETACCSIPSTSFRFPYVG